MKQKILNIFGFMFLAIAIIGTALPIMPTVPFVIAAVICFSKNEKMLEYMRRNAYFREYIDNYLYHTGLRKSVKIKTVVFVTVACGISFLMFDFLWSRIITASIAVIGVGYVLLSKTLK